MAAIDFPSAPAPGQEFTVGNTVWTWDGVKWTAYPGSMAMPDAPPGALYGRRDNAWSLVSHTDITDWTTALVPYALTTSIPVASSSPPLMDGTAAVGTSAAFARGDHVHPTDTSITTALGNYLLLAGGTMSGPVTNLTLAADPTAAAQAATKHYVDSAVVSGVTVNPNRLINGDMYVDQRNGGNSGVAVNTYTVDRWYCAGSQSGKLGWRQAFLASTKAVGFNASLLMSGPSTPYAPLAGDLFFFGQPIEADMVTDFLWGSAGALPVTLSFWFVNAVAGTYSGSIFNYAGTRSYPFTFTIAGPAAQQCVITIPGDTGGTWVMGSSGGSMWVVFDFGCGSTYRGASGATAGWTSSNLRGVTGTVQPVNTVSANIFLTGVKLELGNVATPYPQQSLSQRLTNCQRYYQALGNVLGPPNVVGIQGYAGAASIQSCTIGYSPMRATPTAGIVGTFTNTNAGTVNMYPGQQTLLLQANPPAAGGFAYYNNASSFISLSAEL